MAATGPQRPPPRANPPAAHPRPAAAPAHPPAEPAADPLGLSALLVLGAMMLLVLAAAAIALKHPEDTLWLGLTVLIAVVLAGYGVYRVASHDAPASAPAHGRPVAATPAAAAAHPPAHEGGSVMELRRELERYQALEKQLTHAKQEAEAAMMAKGEFLATMSHEIRTPLNGIIPLLDIVLSTQLAPDQRDYLQTAYQSARQLLSIVDDILDYSKIEANKLELETVGINIKEIVDSVTRLMGKNAEGKGLRFSATIDPGVRLAMRGDSVRLRQVLTNLVSNAIKFTERGQIAIEVRKKVDSRTHAELLFSVRDTGVGIAPEIQARLFKPFTQADASTTRLHGGTGLGLVICKRIVDLMGGQIGVKSEAGRGSTFWFVAPLLKAVGDVAPSRSDVHGARAMIVTTDQTLLRRISGYFTTWGVNYVQTSVSAEALAKLRSAGSMGDSWAYDFLILDWGAMKNTALSLARNVMRESSLGSVRIVAISGEEEVPTEFRGSSRMAVFGRHFGDVDLRSGMQRLLDVEAAGESAAAPTVDSFLPPQLPAEGAPAAHAAAPSARAATGAPAAAPAAAAPAHALPPGVGIGGHVLLVEDNAVNRQVAQRLLGLIGVTFDVAENGKQALERLEAANYDAVLMDCQMPIMDGYTATRGVRKLEGEGKRPKRMSIIAMTANAMAGDREKCLAAGMDDYMSKPLNRALLEQVLRKWLPPGIKPHPVAAPVSVLPPAPRAPPSLRPAAPSPAAPATVVRAPVAYTGSARTGSPIDQDVIQDLLEMMGSEFTDLVRVYLEDTPKSVVQLERAAMSGNVEGLIAPAHSLKSTSANLGALSLSEMAKKIEHGARSGALPGEPVMLVGELSAEFQRVASEFKRLLGTAPAA
jgi:signal transduction histidine kinase/CheY-like chemotaxis protein/HPt (histidine-containing phosphotransfer) domain-containing protein